jgi:hypothetical protein
MLKDTIKQERAVRGVVYDFTPALPFKAVRSTCECGPPVRLRQSRLNKDKVKRQRPCCLKSLIFKDDGRPDWRMSLSFAVFVEVREDKVGVAWSWEPVAPCRRCCRLHKDSLANGCAGDKGGAETLTGETERP